MAAAIFPRLRRFLIAETGAVSPLFVAALPMFMLLAGLAIDGPGAFSEQSVLQATANSAALAAALDLRTLPATGTSSITTDATTYANTKNLSGASNGTVLKSADVKVGNWNTSTHVFTQCTAFSDPITCTTPSGTLINAVQVLVKRNKANNNVFPTALLALPPVYRTGWQVSALAVAIRPSNGGACFVQTAGGSIAMQNNGTITVNGCNAQFDGAISGKNNNSTIATNGGAVEFGTTGSDSGVSVSPSPAITGVAAPSDPYTNLSAPTNGAVCSSATVTIDSTHAPTSTCYSGTVTISGGSTSSPLSLPSSIYFNGASVTATGVVTIASTVTTPTLTFNGGSLTVNGSAQFNSLTVALTGSGSNWGIITGNNNDTMTISSPSSGTYQGIAIYGDPAGGNNVEISGKNSFSLVLTGALYMPAGLLDFKNGAGSITAASSSGCAQVMIQSINVKNSLTVTLPDQCSSSGVFALGHAKLVY